MLDVGRSDSGWIDCLSCLSDTTNTCPTCSLPLVFGELWRSYFFPESGYDLRGSVPILGVHLCPVLSGLPAWYPSMAG